MQGAQVYSLVRELRFHMPSDLKKRKKKKKNEMDLVGIMLSEISQRKTNTVSYHLYMESKK